MFTGQYQYNIDDKSRLVIPQEYRSLLGDSFYITKGVDQCIAVYTIEAWNSRLQNLTSLDYNEQSNRKMLRNFTGYSFKKGFDSQGRVKLEDALIDYSKIDKQCVLVGVNDMFEIWSLDTWKKFQDEADE